MSKKENLVFGTGALKIPQEERAKAISFQALPLAKEVNSISLPAKFRLGRVATYNQGAFSMCVTMALARYESHAYLREFKKNEKFGPAFCYGNRGKGDPYDNTVGEGMYPDRAIKSFIANGIPLWTDIPIIGNYKTCHAKITEELKAKALPQHALTGVCLFPDHIWWGKGKGLSSDEILAIKTLLYTTQMPIFFSADIYQKSFVECPSRGGKVSLVSADPNDYCVGTHAMSIEGWNEEGMVVTNSWGETWGDGTGDCVFPWNYDSYMDFWAITDYIAPVAPVVVDPPVIVDPPVTPDPIPVIPSIPLTGVVDAKHRRVTFTCESEALDYLWITNLSKKTIKHSGPKAKFIYKSKEKGNFICVAKVKAAFQTKFKESTVVINIK